MDMRDSNIGWGGGEKFPSGMREDKVIFVVTFVERRFIYLTVHARRKEFLKSDFIYYHTVKCEA
jgi:hypothetical protein